MHTPCPHCESPLATSSVGFMCTNCGRLYRYAEPDETVDSHNDVSPHGSYSTEPISSHKTQTDQNQAIKSQDQGEQAQSPEPQTQSRPQIINHHASSHYRRRLHERIHNLERPELEPPDDISSLHTDYSPEVPAVNEPTPAFEQPHPVVTPLVDAAATFDRHEVSPMTEEPEEELWGPHKPSPHILDVAGSHPQTEESNELLPPSPLDLRTTESEPTSTHVSEHIQPHATSVATPQAPIHTQSRGQNNDAFAKADALLAAASTPAPSKRSANLIWLAVTAVIVISLGSFLVLSLLKPPTPKTTPSGQTSPSTSQTPISTQSASSKRDAQRKADLNDIAVGLSAYQKTTGKYPVGNDVSALQPLTTANPPFIKALNSDPLNDPSNGVVLKYGYTSDGTTYTLTANLENKSDADAKNGLYIVKSPSN